MLRKFPQRALGLGLIQALEIVTAMLSLSVGLTSAYAAGLTGTFPDEKIAFAGIERHYRLVVPKSLDPKRAAPILFAFHGLGDSKDLMPIYSQLDVLADKEAFILVYPNAVKKMWPLGGKPVDEELAFFDELLASISKNYKVDSTRVYLCGMSNGAYFTHLVASQRSEKIAAIACHSGGLGLVGLMDLKVKHKYGVFVMHGANDRLVSIEEGRKTHDAYQRWGHSTKLVELPNHGHRWGVEKGVNDQMWEFFTKPPKAVKVAPQKASSPPEK